MNAGGRYKRAGGALLGLMLGWGAAFAAGPGLYQAEVGVTGQDAQARSTAIGEALKRVAVKATGVEPAPVTVEVDALPEGLVRQYAYRPHCTYATDQGDAPWCLWVDLDPATVRNWLRTQEVSVWAAPRPALLVWALVSENGRRERVARDTVRWQAVVDRVTRARGAVVTLPLQDAADRQALPDGALWGDFEHDVRAASQRYTSQMILVGRIMQVGETWEARWTLYPETAPPERWREAAADRAGVFEAGLRTAVTRVAKLDRAGAAAPSRPAALPAPGGDLPETGTVIEVAGVDSLADYAQVLDSLQGQAATRGIQPLAVDADRLWLRLPPQMDRAAVIRTLARIPGWERLRDTAPDSAPPQYRDQTAGVADTLRYRWTP